MTILLNIFINPKQAISEIQIGRNFNTSLMFFCLSVVTCHIIYYFNVAPLQVAELIAVEAGNTVEEKKIIESWLGEISNASLISFSAFTKIIMFFCAALLLTWYLSIVQRILATDQSARLFKLSCASLLPHMLTYVAVTVFLFTADSVDIYIDNINPLSIAKIFSLSGNTVEQNIFSSIGVTNIWSIYFFLLVVENIFSISKRRALVISLAPHTAYVITIGLWN